MTTRRPLPTRILEALIRPERVVLAWEADRMEAEHGAGALQVVRERILAANKGERRRLYRLHDEIARRCTDPVALDALLLGSR
ncbi:MAG TPA: hypothetical protein VEA15_08705 [Caulobacteraceae bacterium]|nr:hypothetical protein [Caulobacteraceae bacterium]